MNKNLRRNFDQWKNNEFTQDMTECCKEPHIAPVDGSFVCMNCGIVAEKEIVNLEVRAFTIDEINNRKRTEKKWREVGPRTLIGKEKTDSNGNLLDVKEKILYNRLGKIQNSLIDSLERNFWEAKPKLKMITSKLNIPDYISETAWRIYVEAAKKKLTMGRSIIGFVTASLYAAIRIHELSMIFDDVYDIELVPRRTVHQALGLLVKIVLPELGYKYKPITSRQLVYRFGNSLTLPMEVQNRAIELLEKVSQNRINTQGKDPRGYAASAIYIAAREFNNLANRRTQAEVSNVAKITEVTLRSRAKDIRKCLNH